jgi:predicted ribosome quality control (RQC) complex YloA/Tae2 family protein
MWWVEEGGAVAASDGPCDPELEPPPPTPPHLTAPRFTPSGEETWDQAAERWFSAAVAADELAELRGHVLQRVDRRRAQLRRLMKNLEGDLEAALGAPELRADADCLAAELARIRRGTQRVEVPDIHRGEGTRTISLDPTRAPAETLSRMYAKAGRLERAQDEIIVRIQVAEDEDRRLGAARQTAPTAALAELRGLIRELKLPDLQSPKPVQRSARAPWTTWTDGDHHTVLVGRDAPGNHRLVFRQARGRDLWIHLRDRPSAHVVIPVDRKGPPPDEVVAFGVELALRSARIPAGQSEDLRIARVADLRAVPDGAPGEVSVTRERVVRAAPQPRAFPQWVRQDG